MLVVVVVVVVVNNAIPKPQVSRVMIHIRVSRFPGSRQKLLPDELPKGELTICMILHVVTITKLYYTLDNNG